MTPEQVAVFAHLERCAELLKAHRPGVLRPVRGLWNGPSVDEEAPQGFWFQSRDLRVLVSPWAVGGADLSTAEPSDLWLHVSVSRPSVNPSYLDMLMVRRKFFTDTDTVIQVFPPANEHVNLHGHCLHLWAPLDGRRPIPDLRSVDGGV